MKNSVETVRFIGMKTVQGSYVFRGKNQERK